MIDKVKNDLKSFLIDNGFNGDFKFETPPRVELGDLCLNVFNLVDENGIKGSLILANKIVNLINSLKDESSPFVIKFGVDERIKIIDKINMSGPYVNFYLNNGKLAEIVLQAVAKKNYGKVNVGKGKKVMIEYPSQNTHKEFHIGHLRNVCIGNTLVSLFNKGGYKAIPINYINDFGAHVVKCLWGIMKNHQIEISHDKSIENKQKWLGEMYAEASNYIKDHEKEVKPELDDLQKKLEARDVKIMKLFNQTRKWSIDGFAKLSQELGLKHTKIFYESDVKDKGQKIVDQLLKKKIAEVGEGGALIIDLKKYGLDIALLRKSSGAGVYLTSDLALAVEKFKKIKVDESINITGTEQNFYFKQLFKILELSGFKNKMTHIGYGLVNLPEGKMSSRAGNVILYEDLRNEIYNKIFIETKNRHADWSEKKIKNTARILTMAILKFTMQKHEAIKVITFDMQEAVSFEGFSAPYILYVVARINSLLKKSKINQKIKVNYNLLNNPEEKKLLILMGEYEEIILKALHNYNPSVITKYCFDLAQAFNDFYNKQIVLGEDKALSKVRLALCASVRIVLQDALNLLTIETVKEM